MPITTQQEYGFSHSPSYSRSTTTHRYISVSDAINMVVRGEIDAMDVFSAMPKDMQNSLNKLVSDSSGKQFKEIPPEEQKNVFMMVSIAQGNSNSQIQDEPQAFSTKPAHTTDNSRPLKYSEPPPQPIVSKKWWQFWR